MVHRASTSCHRTGAQSSPKIFDHRRPLPPHLLQTTVDEADAVDVVVVAAAADHDDDDDDSDGHLSRI